jgi:hypothetical protein
MIDEPSFPDFFLFLLLLLEGWLGVCICMYLGRSKLQRNPCPGYDTELAKPTKNGEEKLRALGG